MEEWEAREVEDFTPREVETELKRHGVSLADFVAEVGEKPYYSGEEVLNWLGY